MDFAIKTCFTYIYIYILQDEETEALLSADFEIGHFFRERIIPKVMQQTSSQFQYPLPSNLSSIRLSILRNYFRVETFFEALFWKRGRRQIRNGSLTAIFSYFNTKKKT